MWAHLQDEPPAVTAAAPRPARRHRRRHRARPGQGSRRRATRPARRWSPPPAPRCRRDEGEDDHPSRIAVRALTAGPARSIVAWCGVLASHGSACSSRSAPWQRSRARGRSPTRRRRRCRRRSRARPSTPRSRPARCASGCPGRPPSSRSPRPQQLPIGTTFDTTAGRVTLTSAADTKGATQHAWFYEGTFTDRPDDRLPADHDAHARRRAAGLPQGRRRRAPRPSASSATCGATARAASAPAGASARRRCAARAGSSRTAATAR